MLISKLLIKNFKNISNIEIANFYSIKSIIGANGIGKSNLLSLIAFFSTGISSSFNNYLTFYNKSTLDLLPFADINKPINITFTFANNDLLDLYVYEVAIKYASHNSFNVEIENIIDLSNKTTTSYCINSKPNASLTIGNKHYIENKIKNYLSSVAYYNSYTCTLFWSCPIANYNNKHLNTTKESVNNFIHILIVLKQDYNNIFNEIITLIKCFNPLIIKVEASADNKDILIYLLDSAKPIKLTTLSEGSLRFFMLLILLKLPANLRPNLLLIEEPEIGLNPFLVEIIADLIDSYSQSSQVIFTTHSTLLLNKLPIESVKVLNFNEQGQLKLHSIDKNKISGWLEHYKLGDLWLMNIIGGSILN